MITEANIRFIDEFTRDGTGWARFDEQVNGSVTMTHRKRYRLGRIINPKILERVATFGQPPGMEIAQPWRDVFGGIGTDVEIRRVIFLMLNPSTADAFKPDQTVGKCCKFAQRWSADVLEVVNLFAFRTPYPTDLFRALDLGDGPDNDQQIIEACTQPGVFKVVAAWGNHGGFRERDKHVRKLLEDARSSAAREGGARDRAEDRRRHGVRRRHLTPDGPAVNEIVALVDRDLREIVARLNEDCDTRRLVADLEARLVP